MKAVKTLALTTALTAGMTGAVSAADYSDDIHKNDFSWMQFNYMYALEELPRSPDAPTGHDYLEMEFGGRSGMFSLYGYVDVFNPTERKSSDKNGDAAKMFMKLAPRVSLDALTGKDLSFGPVKEVYFSTLFNWGGNAVDVNNSFWGIGADVEVPWLGTTGMNLYALYDLNAKDWNGYQFSANWFKPLHNFDNGSFVSFQGYVDWQFGADKHFEGNAQTSNGGAAFFGLFWHSEQFALGYGLKAYNDVYLIPDSDGFESTGISHYFSASYKF
ncbi:outer membrane protein OmpK [Shewanella sp. GXUN23E]|uniref:nucleoside-specific channel-forming Tsx family protein n=1 Tax=Shewanella sp. GXUN23E TaxID=3422498 RepID=UPI003D7D918F